MRLKCRIGMHEWVNEGVTYKYEDRVITNWPSYIPWQTEKPKIHAHDRICVFCEKIELNGTQALERQHKEDMVANEHSKKRAVAQVKLTRLKKMRDQAG